MNRALVEKSVVAVLFVLVLILFSYADRDSKKIKNLYTGIARGSKEIAGISKMLMQKD